MDVRDQQPRLELQWKLLSVDEALIKVSQNIAEQRI